MIITDNKKYCLQNAMKIMHIYYINVADVNKKYISAIFHTENFQIRIIIIIEILEFDINLSDVK